MLLCSVMLDKRRKKSGEKQAINEHNWEALVKASSGVPEVKTVQTKLQVLRRQFLLKSVRVNLTMAGIGRKLGKSRVAVFNALEDPSRSVALLIRIDAYLDELIVKYLNHDGDKITGAGTKKEEVSGK